MRPTRRIFIDTALCRKDGICQWICPGNVIETDGAGWPKLAAEADVFCIECGQCVAICPHGAISHSCVKKKACTEIDGSLHINKAQAAQFLRARRSIRHFKPQPVERTCLLELLKMASYAPSGGNEQEVKWIVLDNKELIKMIGKTVKEYMEYYTKENNVENLLPAGTENTDEDYIFWDAPVVILAVSVSEIDYAIALTYLDLYASAMGLGCCWAGYFHFALDADYQGIKKKIGLEKGLHFYPIIVGWPDERIKFYRLPERREPNIQFMKAEQKNAPSGGEL